MKIRNGFVSNSSSSSFLIIYKKNENFFKFNQFDGYNVFIEDFRNAKSSLFNKEAYDFIYNLIGEYIYKLSHNFGHYYGNKRCFDDLYDICQLSNTNVFDSDGDIDKLITPINKIRKKFWNNLNKDNKKVYDFAENLWHCGNSLDVDDIVLITFDGEDRKAWIDNISKYGEEVDDYIHTKSFDKKLNKITKKICKGLKKNKLNVKVLEYEDHDAVGSMMEHIFMPFLASNPEGNFSIFISNNH